MKYIPCEQDAWTEAIEKSKQTKKFQAAPAKRVKESKLYKNLYGR